MCDKRGRPRRIPHQLLGRSGRGFPARRPYFGALSFEDGAPNPVPDEGRLTANCGPAAPAKSTQSPRYSHKPEIGEGAPLSGQRIISASAVLGPQWLRFDGDEHADLVRDWRPDIGADLVGLN